MWYVYMVTCSDDSIYTGITNDLEARIGAHNNKKGAKYTRSRIPVKLSAYWGFKNRSEASKHEYKYKQLKRTEKLNMISNWLKGDLPSDNPNQ